MKTWKTTDEAMKELGVAPIDPNEEQLSYALTIANDAYFGDYMVCHGICQGDALTHSDFKRTYDEAISSMQEYESMRWPAELHQYIDGKYVRIGERKSKELHGEFDARITFEEA